MNKTLKMLKTSFTQFLYAYYEELLRDYSQEEAKKITLQMSSELLVPFTGVKDPAAISYFSLLKDWETEWKEKELKAIKQNDYETQEDAMDILNALKVLIPYAEKRDEEKNKVDE